MGLYISYRNVSDTEMGLCFRYRNGAMFRTHVCLMGLYISYRNVSDTEMGLCFRYRNGAMFRTHVCLRYINGAIYQLQKRFSYRNGAMFQIQKWGYVSVAEMGLCLGLINAPYVHRGGTRQGGQRRK